MLRSDLCVRFDIRRVHTYVLVEGGVPLGVQTDPGGGYPGTPQKFKNFLLRFASKTFGILGKFLPLLKKC